MAWLAPTWVELSRSCWDGLVTALGARPSRLDRRRRSPLRKNSGRSASAAGPSRVAPFASFADRSTSVLDKEYFPNERSAAARSHAAGTPGHAPEGVLAVVCLDNPRDNTRGKVL